jgi:hypothetical protein
MVGAVTRHRNLRPRACRRQLRAGDVTAARLAGGPAPAGSGRVSHRARPRGECLPSRQKRPPVRPRGYALQRFCDLVRSEPVSVRRFLRDDERPRSERGWTRHLSFSPIMAWSLLGVWASSGRGPPPAVVACPPGGQTTVAKRQFARRPRAWALRSVPWIRRG